MCLLIVMYVRCIGLICCCVSELSGFVWPEVWAYVYLVEFIAKQN